MSNERASSLPLSTNLRIRQNADYQHFSFDENGNIRSVRGRMLDKLKAFSDHIPDLRGLSVLDIGCDFGFWCFMAAQKGASKVVGIDRNRKTRANGWVDLVDLNNQIVNEWPLVYGQCSFKNFNIGIEWPELGEFDVIFMCSVYHHIYAHIGDHKTIWEWVAEQCKGIVIWEGPIDLTDSVARKHIPKKHQGNYVGAALYNAMNEYFYCEYSGAAIHETTRTVYKLRRLMRDSNGT